MDDPHGNVSVLDATVCIMDFFVELVSCIDHGHHKVVKIVIVRQFDVFIFSSCL